jgi:hypothetical protein
MIPALCAPCFPKVFGDDLKPTWVGSPELIAKLKPVNSRWSDADVFPDSPTQFHPQVSACRTYGDGRPDVCLDAQVAEKPEARCGFASALYWVLVAGIRIKGRFVGLTKRPKNRDLGTP